MEIATKTAEKKGKVPKRKMGRQEKKEAMYGYLFISALILQFVIFVLGALIYSFYASFTDWNLLKSKEFVGLSNYVHIFKDEQFWKATYNTVFLMIGIPIGMCLSLLLALAMNRKMRGAKFFRVIYYLPGISSAIAIAILWKWIYHTDYGILNNILWSVFGIQGPNWLGDAVYVKPALIIMGIWRGLGGGAILYLAGLQNIDSALYEAVEIDGGNPFHKLKHITIPMLTPMSFYIVITGVIGGLQAFGDTYVMFSGGGPEYSAATIVYYLWQKAFNNYEMGYACAVSWILAIAIFIITLIQFKFSNKWVYEAN
jgi:multiple sugar transport system permease protein